MAIKTDKYAVGMSATPSRNFTISAPDDGTLRIGRGNDGSETSFPFQINPDDTVSGAFVSGSKNKIINGKMEIAQRGTSFPAAPSSTFGVDRWLFGFSGTSAVATLSQQSDVPISNEFRNSLRVAITTADASIAAGDSMSVQHRIEGYNARDLIGKTFTVSFWVRSSKTGIHCVSFANGGVDRSYLAEYTVLVANNWEYKTVTVTGGLIIAGTWDWLNGNGLAVRFPLAAGSTFQSSAGSWQTGNFTATPNQVNCLDTIGNIFAITGVQLEVGSVATPFEHRPIGQELALCQRYFQLCKTSFVGFCGAATNFGGVANYKVSMRGAPTIAQAQNNVDFAAVNVGATSSYAGADGGGVTVFRLATVSSATQFSEVFSASAEL